MPIDPGWEGWTQATWYPRGVSSVARVRVGDGRIVARGLIRGRERVFTPDDTRFSKGRVSIRTRHDQGDLLLVLWGRTDEVAYALTMNGFAADA